MLFRGSSLVTKAGIVASALSLLVGATASMLSFYVANDQIKHAINMEMDYRSETIAIHLKNGIEEIAGNLELMAGNKLVANALADSAGRDNYLRPYLNSISRIGGIQISIMLTDYAGRPLAFNAFAMDLKLGSTLARQVVASKSPSVSIVDKDGVAHMAMAWPVLYANTGLPEGALVFAYDLNVLLALFPESLRREGFKVTWSHGDTEGFVSIIQGTEEPKNTISVSKPMVISGPFKGWQCEITVWTDKSHYQGEFERLLVGYGIIGLLGTTLIVPLGLFVTRKLLYRLKLLEVVALDVVDTHSLDQRFPESGKDEIASVGKAFNLMLTDLKDAQRELKSEANREVYKHSQRIKRILAKTVEGYVRIDVKQGLVLEVNKAFCTFATNSAGEWENASCPEYLQGFLKLANGAEGTTSWPGEEVVIQGPDGVERMFLAHASLDIDEEGTKQIAVFFTNITLLREAEQAVHLANKNLQLSLQHLERRDGDLTALNRMNDLLLAAQEHSEAYAIIAQTASKVFTETSGTISTVVPDGQALETVVRWGTLDVYPTCFSTHDCWGLRQGKAFFTPKDSLVRCAHMSSEEPSDCVCLPLSVSGRLFGLLWSQLNTSDHTSSEGFLGLLTSFAESIKLSLSNLQLREALLRQAICDPLTGLYNRRHLTEVMGRELSKTARTALPLSVVLFDLDKFKSVNDTYGHEAGDVVLIRFAKLLVERSRKGDMAFRLGGEEFVLMLPATGVEGAMTCADAIRSAFEGTSIHISGSISINLTVSSGLASAPQHGMNEATLLRKADNALYQAKQSGRNTVRSAHD